jgi:hypothetical protein
MAMGDPCAGPAASKVPGRPFDRGSSSKRLGVNALVTAINTHATIVPTIAMPENSPAVKNIKLSTASIVALLRALAQRLHARQRRRRRGVLLDGGPPPSHLYLAPANVNLPLSKVWGGKGEVGWGYLLSGRRGLVRGRRGKG